MFQLIDNDANLMGEQNAIPSKQHLGGALPYAFTEHGGSASLTVTFWLSSASLAKYPN